MKVKRTRLLFSTLMVVIAVLFIAACSTPTSTPQPTAATKPGETPSPTTGATPLAATAMPTATPSKVWTLKYDTYLAATIAVAITDKYFYDAVAAQSGGRIKVEYYYSESLHRGGEQLRAVRDGTSETGYHPTTYTPSLLPLSVGLDNNYLTKSPDAMMMAVKELYDAYYPLRYEWEVKNNVRPMYFVAMEPVTLVSKKPINSVDDLKGMKIRAAGITADTLTRLGATPVNLVLTEAYEAMTRGTVDGVFNIPFTIAYTMKFYEAGKYWTDIGAGVYANAANIMNMDVWKSLPPDLQDIFVKNAAPARDYYIKTLNTLGAAAVDDMVAKNLAGFTTWSGDSFTKARDMVQPAQMNGWIDQVKSQGFDGKELMTKLQELLKKYEPQTKYVSGYDYYVTKYGKK